MRSSSWLPAQGRTGVCSKAALAPNPSSKLAFCHFPISPHPPPGGPTRLPVVQGGPWNPPPPMADPGDPSQGQQPPPEAWDADDQSSPPPDEAGDPPPTFPADFTCFAKSFRGILRITSTVPADDRLWTRPIAEVRKLAQESQSEPGASAARDVFACRIARELSGAPSQEAAGGRPPAEPPLIDKIVRQVSQV